MTVDFTKLEATPWTVWVVNTGTSTYPMSTLYPDLADTPFGATIDVPNNAVILGDGHHLVLLDTGLRSEGNTASAAPILDALELLQLAPDAVDLVIISHLHPDHLGALTSGQHPTTPFPYAQHHLHRDEWNYFSNQKNLGRHQGRVADAVRIALPVLSRTSLTLIDQPSTVLPGLTIRLASGHTPGHCIAEIGSPPSALYIADLVAQHRQLTQPALKSGFDHDNDQALSSRLKVLNDARERNVRIIGSHLPTYQFS